MQMKKDKDKIKIEQRMQNMKKFYIILLMMFSIFIKSQISYSYKSFAIINNSDIGEIFPTTSTVIFNYEKKIITIIKADKSKENYKIISKKENGFTSSGNKYFAVLTRDNNYEYFFTFFENKLMLINKITRNGIVFYK